MVASSGQARPSPVSSGQALNLTTSAFGFRPPPIRTVASLEGWGAATPPPTSMQHSSSVELLHSMSDAHASYAPAPPPPSPRAQRSERSYHGVRSGFGFGMSAATAPMSLVAPGLYVGDEAAAANLATLREAGVTHVLNCSALANPLEGQAGAPAAYMQLGLLDNTSDLPRMQEALVSGVEFITQAHASGGTVLVHCHRGISRSATLAIAYLVRATQQPAETVFEAMRTKRKCIDPNLGYWVALKTWERRVLPPGTVALERRASFSSPVRPLSRAG